MLQKSCKDSTNSCHLLLPSFSPLVTSYIAVLLSSKLSYWQWYITVANETSVFLQILLVFPPMSFFCCRIPLRISYCISLLCLFSLLWSGTVSQVLPLLCFDDLDSFEEYRYLIECSPGWVCLMFFSC